MSERKVYTWQDLQNANALITTIDVKGKNYAEVPQRIKAFRSVCPMGSITTEMLSNAEGICVFKATICDESGNVLGTGTAYEKESSSFINKTSYIENCETSAVGRALGMCGFGIDTSIASAEEVLNAMKNQEKGKQDEKKGYFCVDCEKEIVPVKANGKKYTAEELADMSLKKYGKVLCPECANRAKWVMEHEGDQGNTTV